MSASLHLVQMRLQRPQLVQFAHQHSLNLRHDEDDGYALHAWLAAMFGELAPKPFRWWENRAELLGYARHDRRVLEEHATAFAMPAAHAVLQSESLQTKPMPSEWRSGLRLRIDVLACPVSRNRGIEKDIYLREIERANPSPRSRESVYLDWFRQQWEGVVEFDSLSLTAFRRGMLLRRGHESGGDRTSHALERPRAQFNAIATISDGGAFHERLVRGIGRHRSFGFGMVLLARP